MTNRTSRAKSQVAQTSMLRSRRAAAAVVVALLAFTGCSTGNTTSALPQAPAAYHGADAADVEQEEPRGNDNERAPMDREDAMIAFTRCMRDNGVDMPDPDADGHMMFRDTDTPEFGRAMEACRQILEDSFELREGDRAQAMADMEETLLELAACMRARGHDFPDPDMSGGAITIGPPDGVMTDAFRADMAECQPAEWGLATTTTGPEDERTRSYGGFHFRPGPGGGS